MVKKRGDELSITITEEGSSKGVTFRRAVGLISCIRRMLSTNRCVWWWCNSAPNCNCTFAGYGSLRFGHERISLRWHPPILVSHDTRHQTDEDSISATFGRVDAVERVHTQPIMFYWHFSFKCFNFRVISDFHPLSYAWLLLRARWCHRSEMTPRVDYKTVISYKYSVQART